jgi:hypothetical protein
MKQNKRSEQASASVGTHTEVARLWEMKALNNNPALPYAINLLFPPPPKARTDVVDVHSHSNTKLVAAASAPPVASSALPFSLVTCTCTQLPSPPWQPPPGAGATTQLPSSTRQPHRLSSTPPPPSQPPADGASQLDLHSSPLLTNWEEDAMNDSSHGHRFQGPTSTGTGPSTHADLRKTPSASEAASASALPRTSSTVKHLRPSTAPAQRMGKSTGRSRNGSKTESAASFLLTSAVSLSRHDGGVCVSCAVIAALQQHARTRSSVAPDRAPGQLQVLHDIAACENRE